MNIGSNTNSLQGLKNLRLLSLGDNKITNITHRTFKTNVRLYVLDMHNNRYQDFKLIKNFHKKIQFFSGDHISISIS